MSLTVVEKVFTKLKRKEKEKKESKEFQDYIENAQLDLLLRGVFVDKTVLENEKIAYCIGA